MSVRVRFAPSPTGHLHIGGARTALFNHLYARRHRGTFILRIEDTDAARSTEESLEAILDGMRWLGLSWDEGPGVGGAHGPYFQSQRRERYREVARALVEAGRAYPCFCTPEEIERRRAEQQARGEAPRYDGACRSLDASQRAAHRAAGRLEAVRFALVATGESAWEDMVRGRIAFENALLDDFVLLRADGWPTYNFACVVDDHDMAISHVLRGDDHISNTPRQLLLYGALGWEVPGFAHLPMILGEDGTRLSKRHGATSVGAYRDLGYLPEAMVNFLALLGWAYDGQRELFTLAELEALFAVERVGSNPSVFNSAKLEWMNAQYLKGLPEEERVARVWGFLEACGPARPDRTPEWRTAFVRTLGDRIRTLADAATVGRFALEDALDVEPAAWIDLQARPAASERLEAIADRLAADPEFTLESVERVTRGLSVELGIKAGELIGAMRIALTGSTASPGIFEVLHLLGRERSVERLRLAAGRWADDRAGSAR